ncbi:MAG: SPFH domain-containing protein [Treponema sp.]|nr:SPFH domain-containing protein [Treponema sp.]
MGLFGKKDKPNEGGLMDAIRCDETDYLIWKWRPKGNEAAGTTRKENAIRWGSSISVKDGEVAVFLYHQKDGTQMDCLEGPYNDTIKTANFPVLSSIVGLAFGGGSPFQAEVYYINLAGLITSRFGVPYFDVFDPRLQEFPVPVAVRGSFKFGITNYREFIKLHRLTDFSMEAFQEEVKDTFIKFIKGCVVDIPGTNGIPLVQIETKILQVNDIVEQYVQPRLLNAYGVTLKSLDITNIEIDKTSDGWERLKNLTADYTESQMRQQQKFSIGDQELAHDIQVENLKESQKLQMENLKESQRAQMENMKETLRIQREEGQYAQHLQTGMNMEAQKAQIEAGLYGSKLDAEQRNIGAYGIKHQTQVGLASAEAMGKLASAGGINLGSGTGPGGINPGAMMANMAMGQSVGLGMANMMGNAFGTLGQNFAGMGAQPGMQSMPPSPPQIPPLPNASKSYNVAVNGISTGPFTIQILQNMVQTGQLNAQSLVWCEGMANWQQAGTVAELTPLFSGTQTSAPPLPPVPPPIG